MDLSQIWIEAIKRLTQEKTDPADIGLLQVIQTQCYIKLNGNNIDFVCLNDLATTLLPRYCFDLLTKINEQMNAHYGMTISNSSSANNASNQVGMPSNQQNFNNGFVSNQNNGFSSNGQNQSSERNYNPQNQGFNNTNNTVEQNSFKPSNVKKNLNLSSSINPDKTFENYVTDPENQTILAAATAIAQDPCAGRYNPFYIYGGSGLGKTHILWAIANRIFQTRPEVSVIYIRAEEFIRKYVESMSKKNSFDPNQVHFQEMFTQHDVFIMDDIQSLTKGDKARDTFFDIIATFLDMSGKQLILAADEPPGKLKNFSERLVTRFGSGVCSEIYPPSSETRAAITLSKCNELNLRLPDSIVDYIANNIRSSVREIEGAIKTLKTHVDLKGEMTTYDEAVKPLSNLVNIRAQTTTLEAIKERVAKECDVTVESMESSMRVKNVSRARALAMTLADELIPALSLNDIARAFNKDHSSVHSAIKKIKTLMEKDTELCETYKQLTLSLKKN